MRESDFKFEGKVQTVKYKMFIFVLIVTLGGCATAEYTPTISESIAPRKTDCKFPIKSTLPADSEWQEIGVVNINVGSQGSAIAGPRNPAEFRELVGREVCRGGGELVIGTVNGIGQYVKGTVFRRIGPKKTPNPSNTNVGGCSYDTQCKGDRICKDRKCVDPG